VSSDLPQSRPFLQSTELSLSKLPDPSPPSLDSPGSVAAGWIQQIATAGIRIGSIMVLTVVHQLIIVAICGGLMVRAQQAAEL
jgi:hypothetical protein